MRQAAIVPSGSQITGCRTPEHASAAAWAGTCLKSPLLRPACRYRISDTTHLRSAAVRRAAALSGYIHLLRFLHRDCYSPEALLAHLASRHLVHARSSGEFFVPIGLMTRLTIEIQGREHGKESRAYTQIVRRAFGRCCSCTRSGTCRLRHAAGTAEGYRREGSPFFRHSNQNRIWARQGYGRGFRAHLVRRPLR